MEKSLLFGDNFYIPNNPIEKNSNNTLLKGEDLGTLVRICQNELFNHTHDIGLVHTDSVLVLLVKLVALLLKGAVLKVAQS